MSQAMQSNDVDDLDRLIIESQSDDGSIDISDQKSLRDELLAWSNRRTAAVLERLLNERQLPWPESVFGVVPESDWPRLNELTKAELGYPIDRVSGDLMRSGWNILSEDLRKRVAELAALPPEGEKEK